MSTSMKPSNQIGVNKPTSANPVDMSDRALAALLDRLKATLDPIEMRQLDDQIERVVFHRQFRNA
jgi:hypothetical protein